MDINYVNRRFNLDFCLRLFGLLLLILRAVILIVVDSHTVARHFVGGCKFSRYLAVEGCKFGFELLQLVLLAHVLEMMVDSVVCDFNSYPYTAKTYARQMIIRESNVTQRSLVTTCRLSNASRSDDNPNGFIIEGFTILENKDIITTKR